MTLMHDIPSLRSHPVCHPPTTLSGRAKRRAKKSISIGIFILPIGGGRKPDHQGAPAS